MKLSFLLFFIFFMSNSWGITGLDLLELAKQTSILSDQLTKIKKEIDAVNNIVKDSEGRYGFGNLLDNDLDFKNRQWSPDTWESALKNLSGGNIQRYKKLYKAYRSHHPTLSDAQYSKGASKSLLKSYKQEVADNRVAGTIADYEYQLINSHLKHVHQLAKKIEEAKNTKAAIDLNSRLIAELSYISIEELRMQAVVNQQMVSKAYGNIEAKTRESMFNRLPANKE